jgi:pimeloyl-[acyl-carrier protein] methyl ester esterase
MHDIVFIAGWGQPDGGLKLIADEFSNSRQTSVCDLWEKSQCNNKSSELSLYANALVENYLADGEPKVLVGWSMGGCVCLEVANKLPHLVSKLVLLSSTSRFISAEDYQFGTKIGALKKLKSTLRTEPVAVLREFFKAAAFTLELVEESLAEQVKQALAYSMENLTEGLDYLEKVDLRSELSNISQETLLFHGKFDLIISKHASEFMAERIKNSNLNMVNKAGHFLPFTHHRKIAKAIKEFI